MRYSSTFEAFNYERRYIKLMLLYNGYPSTFIENEFYKYLFEYLSQSPFLPLVDDEKQFFLMRHRLLGQPTPRQSQVAMRATTADMDNDQTDVQQIKSTVSYKEKLFVHYTHEKRFQSCKSDMHRVYEDVFQNTPAMHAKLIVGNRNRRDTRHELIRKRPKQSILKNTTARRQQKKNNARLQDNHSSNQTKPT